MRVIRTHSTALPPRLRRAAPQSNTVVSARARGHISERCLVNEAYLKLVDQTRADVTVAHISSPSPRAVSVASSSDKLAVIRRRAWLRQQTVTLDDEVSPTYASRDERADVVALDEALTRLGELDERLSRVVECRFFGGLTEEETANALSVTARTVRRDWVKAKGWLHQALRE